MQLRSILFRTAIGCGLTVLPVGGLLAGELKPQTLQDLKQAVQSEAAATLKYHDFKEQAQKQGNKDLADLLERVAEAERAHFDALTKASSAQQTNQMRLADAIVSEYSEGKIMYTRMAERAEAVGDAEIAKLFRDIAANEEAYHQEFVKIFSKSGK